MVAAEILVAFREAPGNRQAGDVAAGVGALLVRTQHRRADAVSVRPAGRSLRIEGKKHCLPGAPRRGVSGHRLIDAVVETGANVKRRFRGAAPESQREDEAAGAGVQVDLAGQGDIAVGRVVIAPAQLEMPGEILPAVGNADKAGRSREKGGPSSQTRLLRVLQEKTIQPLGGKD